MIPPDATGGEMPDFSQMSPEEAMAWLETLAKRQGVGEDELTTSANLEIAEVPSDVVVDEPGYTPYDPTGKRAQEQAKKEPEEETPPPSTEPETPAEPPVPIETPLPAAEEASSLPPASAAAEDDDLESTIMEDPMAWLETLAKRQGVSDTELTTSANMQVVEPPPDAVVDEPGYTPFDPFGRGKAEPDRPTAKPSPPPQEAEEEPGVEAPPSVAETPAAASKTGAEEEDMMTADPMMWLESLAKRQGVSEDELTTMADMEIEEPSTDAVVDEPGYVPFREMEQQRKGQAAQKAQPEPEPEPEPELELPPAELVTEAEPAAEEAPDLDLSADDLFGDDLDLEPAELPDWLQPAQMVDLPEIPGLEEEAAPPDTAEDGEEPTWLDELADQADEMDLDFSDLPAAEVVSEPDALQDDPLAGMTEEEIEALSASGQMTPEQQQAWLDRQLDSLVENRGHLEEAGEEEELEPAVPGEVPDWLKEQMPGDTEQSSPAAASDSVPDWLKEQMPEGMEVDIESVESEDMPDWLSEQTPEADEEDVVLPAASEADMPDWLNAVAEETQAAGSIDTGEWLDSLADEVEAMEPGALEMPTESNEEEADMAPLPDHEDLPPGEPSTLPDWLSEVDETIETPVEEEQDTSLDWLAEAQALSDEEIDFEESDISAWLTEQQSAPLAPESEEAEPFEVSEPEPAPVDTDLSWLEEADPNIAFPPIDLEEEPALPEPEPEPALPKPSAQKPLPHTPAPQPAPTVEEPPPPLKVEAEPEQVEAWLNEARELKETGDFEASMDKYENLVLTEQRLEELTSDLEDIARQLATNVRIRRLLGDVYMRQNKLQQALDTYRGALDQL